MNFIGPIRLVVCKHAVLHDKKNYTLFKIDYFAHGFISEGKYGDNVSHGGWVEEEIREAYENSSISDALADRPFGYYEILADFMYDSWRTSYEYEEYDTHWKLANVKVNEMTYLQVEQCDDFEILSDKSTDLSKIGERKDDNFYLGDKCIVNQFMPRDERNKRHAYALQVLCEPYSASSKWYEISQMKESEIKDLIHMSMMLIDSESNVHPERYEKALKIDQTVNQYNQEHEDIFKGEEEEE